MKAVRIHDYGDAGVLRYEDAPEPVVAPDEILVRVAAAGVNPLDWKVRAGYMKAALPATLPFTLGWDVAGVVVSAGAEVTAFKVGENVFARPANVRGGGYAQMIAVKPGEAAHTPESLALETAAAVPLAALTAWAALFDKAELDAGQRVLIHAGAGGVGGFAVQLAKNAGAWVAATASGDGVDMVRELGADLVIDHRQQDFGLAVTALDVVFDTVGGEVTSRSLKVLRPGGVVVCIAGFPDMKAAAEVGVRAEFAQGAPDGARLQAIADLFDRGGLRAPRLNRFPLSEAAEAQALSASGRTRGKIILET